MTSQKRFRIGVELLEPFDGMSWMDTARDLEDSGFSTLFVSDHVYEGLGPIAGMAAAASATTTLHVATAVFGVDFRHPAFLARELASIDLLSQGRLEVGIGTGYQEMDYIGSGLRMDPPGTRVDRLIEYVEILKGLFGPEPFSFNGEHYTLTALNGTPKPYTPGGPPIFVAGGGKRVLTFAAQHADIVGVNPSLPSGAARPGSWPDGLPEAIDRKFSWIRDAAGARFDDIEFHAWLKFARVTQDPEGEAEKLRNLYGGADAAEILQSPVILMGDAGEIVERMHERRERWGFSYYTIQQPAVDEFRPILQALNS